MSTFKNILKSYSNIHRPNGKPDFFIFTMPRSGSTWLMELLVTQPSFKYSSELFNIRNPEVCKHLGLDSWDALYDRKNDFLIESYIKKIQSGKLGIFNPNPLGKYYRPITKRIVFKTIHFGEDRINWIRDTFNVKVIFLIRHPMAVVISRKILPRLRTFIFTDYINQFSEEQKKLAKRIYMSGDQMEKATLSWCFQNVPPIRDRSADWAFITYEQLIIEPDVVIKHLSEKLQLVKTGVINKNLSRRSMVRNMSDENTKEIFDKGDAEREALVSKWRNKVSKEDEKRMFNIIRAFNIDIYAEGDFLPNEKYRVNSFSIINS